MSTGLPTPAPILNSETERFWRGAGEGKFLLERCRSCANIIWYPRAFCTACSSRDLEWFEASGRGTIYSFTIQRRADPPFNDAVPFVVAYVELAEGPSIITNIITDRLDDLAIGQEVRVVFASTGDGSAVPRFEPA